MQNSESILEYFFNKSSKIKIPVYQRNYDWKKDNCEQLFRDIEANARRFKANRKHFFGSIIYMVDQDTDKRCIIDGQQRLITTALLLSAMRDMSKSGEIAFDDPAMASRIDGMLVDQYSRCVFIEPVQKDEKAYGAIVLGRPDDYVRDSNLQINYELFKDMLRNLSGDVTVDQFYRSMSGLQVMIIRLNSQDDDAQMVFESINSTGLNLTEGDKIRNFLLMNLEPKIQDRLYEEYWVKIEDNADDISAFFRDYLTAVDAETPNLNRVYQSFKEHAGYQIDAVGIEGLFKKLLGYSVIYKAIRVCDLDFVSPKASSAMYRIHFLDYAVSYPFIMRVLDARMCDKISVSDTEAILEAVENYLLRRAVCRMPTNALNKVFPKLYVSLDKLDVTKDAADKLRYILLEKRGSSAYPRDQEVRDNLAILDIYNTRGLCACVLAILEGVTKESWKVLQHIKSSDPCDRLTIEHVMPQKKTDEWRAEIGDNYDEVHETWLHRLGNLTLTAYNSEFGCGSFEEKKNKQPGGLATSPLNLNQCFKTIDTWDESAIKERNKDMVEQFIGLVPEVKTGYVPEDDGTEMKEASLDQDPRTFNGLVICGYSFRGVRHESRSGIDAFAGMMRELYDCNPQKMMVAEGNKAIGTLGNWMRRSDTDLDGYVQIAPGLYAYKHITNQKKVILLRQAAVLQGIDPSELAFIGHRPAK